MYKINFWYKRMTPKLLVLHSWKKSQVLKKVFLKKNSSSLFVEVKSSKRWAEILWTLFFPMFPLDAPKNIRKPKVFWCFQGDQKGALGGKELIFLCRTMERNSWGKGRGSGRIFYFKATVYRACRIWKYTTHHFFDFRLYQLNFKIVNSNFL